MTYLDPPWLVVGLPPPKRDHLKTCNIVPPRRKVENSVGCFFFHLKQCIVTVFQVFHTHTHTENTQKKYLLILSTYISWIYVWRSFEISLTKFGQPSSWDSHLILGLLVMMAPSKPFLTCHRALWNVSGITNGSGKFIPNTELMYGLFAYIWVV